ncbi:hypothetical protein EDB85DRAFT_1929166 [Lactarius pseudohatsudake]|nr:hypothetical protein EDB85DRAFT_2016240 [Lactarius pseudohatsudake]KAH9039635.1 hypothetical protein EDB85DRAFT_1929166 [Lactarius pseudohatsudake]
MKYSTLLWGLGSCMNFGAAIEYSIFQACRPFSVPVHVPRHLRPILCAGGRRANFFHSHRSGWSQDGITKFTYSCHNDITQNFLTSFSLIKPVPTISPTYR